MAGRSLNISLVATLTPLEKSLAAVGKMMADFANSIAKTDQKLSDSIKASVETMNTELAKVKQSFDNVGNEGDKAGKKAGTSLRQQLRAATIDAQRASEEFGMMSPQFIKAAQKAANLKDEMGDVGKAIDALNPDAKFKALGGIIQGVAGGFMAVQGAMAAMGVESENAQKTMAKLQGMMAFTQGLNQLGELKDAFTAMGTQVKALFSGMSKAMMASGIGLLVVAVGLLAANWDKVTSAVDGVTAAQEKHLEVSKKQAIEADKQLKIVESSDNIYKQQGKSERDILNIKIQATQQALLAHEIEMKGAADIARTQIEAAKRNHEILTGILTALSAPIILILKTVDLLGSALGKHFGLVEKFDKMTNSVANILFDPEEMQKKANESNKLAQENLLELKNKVAGYQNSIKDIDKKAADDKKKLEEDAYKESMANFDKTLAYNSRKLKTALEEEKRVRDDVQKQGFATNFTAKTQKINLIVGELQAPKQLKFPPIKMGAISLDPKEVKKNVELVQAMNRQIESSIEEMAVTIGDQLGKALSGTFSGADFFSSVLTVIGGFLASMGKLLVSYGIAMDAFKKAFSNPYVAIAAGIALIAVGGAVKSKAASLGEQKKMASGGIAYGPTNALVGEYSGARNNPEVVAPLDKLKGMLGGGSDKNVFVRGQISGNDLQLVQVKTSRDLGRITGRR